MFLISVIIPTYNREKYVTEAINSVLNQTFKNYEIIVIDDGSADDTEIILRPYLDKIRYIYQNNMGVSSARNMGISQAKGRWIAFLDSDDEWTEEYLSTQKRQIDEYPHAVAHITNAVTVHLNGEKSSLFDETKLICKFKNRECLIFERPLEIVINHAPWFIQSTIIRKDILLQTGLFDENLSIAEDLCLIGRVALRGGFTFCRKELVKVIRRVESIDNLGEQSMKRGIYRYKSFGKAYTGLLDYDGLSKKEKRTVMRALGSIWRALGNALVMYSRKSEAQFYYKKSLFIYPSARSLLKFLGTFLPQGISRVFVRTWRPILLEKQIMIEDDKNLCDSKRIN